MVNIALAVMPTELCIKSNNYLLGPLGPVVNDIQGAIGGLFYPAIMTMIIITGFLALISVLNKNMTRFIRALIAVPSIAFGLVLILIVFQSLWDWMNNGC